MIIATNVYHVNSENRDATIAAMLAVSIVARQIEGVITHSCYAHLDDPTIIRFYGEFENVEAVNTIQSSQGFKDFKQIVAALGVTTSGAIISTYTPLPENS